jgi:hypothetical protein
VDVLEMTPMHFRLLDLFRRELVYRMAFPEPSVTRWVTARAINRPF